jgi:hypothetical protein
MDSRKRATTVATTRRTSSTAYLGEPRNGKTKKKIPYAMDWQELGIAIAVARMRAKMRPRARAEHLDIDVSHIWRLERGRSVTVVTLLVLTRWAGIDPNKYLHDTTISGD